MKSMQAGMCVCVCVVLVGTVSPMTSSAVCFGNGANVRESTAGWSATEERDLKWKSNEMWKFSIHKHRHQCLYKGTTQCWREQWESTRLSYLCQVGIDPFRECPFLHCLLLICKSEPRASLSVTCNNKQRVD